MAEVDWTITHPFSTYHTTVAGGNPGDAFYIGHANANVYGTIRHASALASETNLQCTVDAKKQNSSSGTGNGFWMVLRADPAVNSVGYRINVENGSSNANDEWDVSIVRLTVTLTSTTNLNTGLDGLANWTRWRATAVDLPGGFAVITLWYDAGGGWVKALQAVDTTPLGAGGPSGVRCQVGFTNDANYLYDNLTLETLL
jgi:hypothetical protein